MGGWLNRLSTRPPTPPSLKSFFLYYFLSKVQVIYFIATFGPASASLFFFSPLFLPCLCRPKKQWTRWNKRKEGALRQGKLGWTGCLGSLSAGLGNREWGIGWMERWVEEGIEGQAWINREVGRDVGNGKIEGNRGRETGEGWRKICRRIGGGGVKSGSRGGREEEEKNRGPEKGGREESASPRTQWGYYLCMWGRRGMYTYAHTLSLSVCVCVCVRVKLKFMTLSSQPFE